MSSKARRKRLMTGFVHSERPDLVCGRCMHVWTGPTSMRLDALLSSVVGVKVKEAQAMVASGEVTVGGAVQCEPRWQIVLGEEASVSVHGQPLLSLGKRPFAHRVLLVHKPLFRPNDLDCGVVRPTLCTSPLPPRCAFSCVPVHVQQRAVYRQTVRQI